MFQRSIRGSLWPRAGVLSLALLALAPRLGADFVEVAAAAGVQFQQVPEPVVPYAGGAVWADFDGDGWVDLFATQSIGCNRLFMNRGDGTFGRRAQAGGAAACNEIGRGATAADYDNDGDQDLYVTNHGQNRLFKNRLVEWGFHWFDDVTVEAGMGDDGARNSASAVWGDYDNDGDLDLFVTNHSLSIALLACHSDLLWRNEGDGTFVELGAELGVADGGAYGMPGCGLAATWSDYDNDGDPDLMVINDFGHTFVPNRLFRNDGPGPPPGGWRLTDVSAEARFDYQMYGMGIAIGDFNRDGLFDYYMSDIGTNNLALNQGDGTFLDVTREAEVEANDVEIYLGAGLVSWGTVFADLDHDGWEDLVVANGGASEELFPGMFGHDYINDNPNYVYWNRQKGPFVEMHRPLGVDDGGHHRNVTFVDYDRDGDLDLHFGVLEGPNRLYRNDAPGGRHWLQVRLRGTVGNRDAIGARVMVTDGESTMMREVDGGSTMLSLNDRMLHFGLGAVGSVPRLAAWFPSGATIELRDLAVDRLIEIAEPAVLISTEGEPRVDRHGESILPLGLRSLSSEAASGILELRTGGTGRLLGRAPWSVAAGAEGRYDLPVEADELGSGHHPVVARLLGPRGELVHQLYMTILVN